MISLNQIYYGIAFIIMIVAGGYVYSLKGDITKLETELKIKSSMFETEKMQNILRETVIDSQNKQVEELRINLISAQSSLNTWKALPQKVKYKVIYRDIVKENNSTGACDEVKTLINSTATINLNTL